MSTYIGLMSGTSMDGIDAVLVNNTSNTLLHALTHPYSDSLKSALAQVLDNKQSLSYFSQLNTLIGREFAEAVKDLLCQSRFPASDVVAIGSHGQTLCHDSHAQIPYTLQLGCAHTIAEMTGIQVVADFRTRDLVVGGQGAPFAPLYHQAIFKKKKLPLAVVNIGGIANVTYLPNETEVYGYDVGPGNCLMDAWVLKHRNQSFDTAGSFAQEGKVIFSLLDALLADPYFQKAPPKSLGKEHFSLTWLQPFLADDMSEADVQATLLQFTAVAIADNIKKLPKLPKQVLLCGGGVHNQVLVHSLSLLLQDVKITSTECYGIHPDYVEALMMAWLAERTINQSPMFLKSITGAKKPAILGVIYPAGIDKSNLHEV